MQSILMTYYKMISGCISFTENQRICVQIDHTSQGMVNTQIEKVLISSELIPKLNFEYTSFSKELYFSADKDILLLYLDLVTLQHERNPANKLKFSLLVQKFFDNINIQHSHTKKLCAEEMHIFEEYIKNSISEQIKIQELAKVLGINQQYLKVRFKNSTGFTIREYIITKRLEHAISLMKTRKYSLQQIAAQVGYSSLSSFSQAFKHKYGISPQSFKNF